MAFFPAMEVINLGEVYFFLLLGSVDARRGWVLASSPSTPRASAVVFLRVSGRSLLSGGSLLSRRWLFSTRCVSKDKVGGLIFSTGVLFVFLPIPSGTPWVHVAGIGGGLQHRLCLCIDRFLDGLFLGVWVSASGI